MEVLNGSAVGQENWTKFDGNGGDGDYFVPTWIIAVYVFFLAVGVCVNVGLAFVLLCSRKNGKFFIETAKKFYMHFSRLS